MNDPLYVYAGCVLVLCLKMFAISCYQGFFRIRRLAFTNLEDAAFFSCTARSEELPQVSRAKRVWANDLENIPLFWVLGGLCIALATSSVVTGWLFVGFTTARMAHTVTYLTELQPWRTLAYGLGVVCLFGLGGLVVLRLL